MDQSSTYSIGNNLSGEDVPVGQNANFWSFLLKAASTASLAVHFVTSTIWGAALLTILAYWLVPLITGVAAWTPAELLNWASGLEETSVVGISTAILTVLGFLVAFHIASVNWKEQALWGLRCETFKALNAIYPQLLSLANELKIFADQVLELHDSQLQRQDREKRLHTKYLVDQIPRYHEKKRDFDRLFLQAYQFTGQYGLVMMGLPRGAKSIEDINNRMEAIGDATSVFIPLVDTTDPEFMELFFWRLEVAPLRNLSLEVECAYAEISVLLGHVNSALLIPVVGLNRHALSHMIFNMPNLGEFFVSLRSLLSSREYRRQKGY